jgi:aryl-alcohol dehydrogenase-like predicted oxidoreductase
MEYALISGTEMKPSRIAQGTWAIGGWMWEGTDEKESIRTIHAALDLGINLIDTAPVYGFGVSEEIVGKAIEERGHREKVFIAAKVGLECHNGSVSRNSSQRRIRQGVSFVKAIPSPPRGPVPNKMRRWTNRELAVEPSSHLDLQECWHHVSG